MTRHLQHLDDRVLEHIGDSIRVARREAKIGATEYLVKALSAKAEEERFFRTLVQEYSTNTTVLQKLGLDSDEPDFYVNIRYAATIAWPYYSKRTTDHPIPCPPIAA